MRNLKFVEALAAAAAVLPAVAPASAQSDAPATYLGMPPPEEGVLYRARPEYDAKGIPLGGFRLFPTLDLTGSYDDNVFRLPDGQSDYFLTVAPSVRLKSQWGRHFFELYSGADYYRYAKYNGENLADWNVGGDGRLDISHAAMLSANASYGEYHEVWSSPNVVSLQAAPNRYYGTHVDVSAVYEPDRLGVGVGGSLDRYDWTNTPLIGGGFETNGDRNEDDYRGYVRVFYDFSPGYSAFIRGTYDDRRFDEPVDRAGLVRSSQGYRLDGGLNLQLSHLLSGEVFAGYLTQRFPQSAANPLPNISGFDFGAQLDWYVLREFTAHLSATRQLIDITLPGISVSDNRRVEVSGDYEFRPNIIVQVRGSYMNSAYVGSSLSDRYSAAGFGVKYLMNRYLTANLNYAYENRSSNRPGADYTDDTVSVGLTVHV